MVGDRHRCFRAYPRRKGKASATRPTLIAPPSNFTQKHAKIHPSTEKQSSSTKRSQERGRPYRRPNRGRSSRTSSHGINSRSRNRSLDHANVRPSRLWFSGIQQYANMFLLGDPSNRSLLHNPAHNATSDLIRSIFKPGKRNRTGSSDDTVDPRATSKSRSNLVSVASSGARLILNGIKESADAFPPLKSAAGALCFILDNCEV